MAISIRPARADEMSQFGMIGAYVYAGLFGDGPENTVSQNNQPEWTLCAFDDDKMVASFSTLPFTMRAVGNAMALGGISAVGTVPEYRRQGLLRRLMTQALLNMYEGGTPMAALWASQAAIYQRYGFAMTTVKRHYRIDSVDVGFFDRDVGQCQVARVALSTEFDTLKQLYIRFAANRACYLHRSKVLWQLQVLNSETVDGPVHAAIAYDSGSQPVGYVVYTLRSGKVIHPARNQEIKIRDLVWLTADAYRSLWRFLASHDLVGAIDWANAPADDPAVELMSEPRLLNTRSDEGCWFRIVDVEKALSARGYATSGKLRLRMADDDLTPWNNGTWQISINDGVASVVQTGEAAQLQLSCKALTSLYTGARTATELDQIGLIKGSPQDLQTADQIFRTPHAPHCPDNF